MGDSEKLETKLFETCFTYLSFDDFGNPDLLKIVKEDKYHLLKYTANFWLENLSFAQQERLRATLFRQDGERANFVALLESRKFSFPQSDPCIVIHGDSDVAHSDDGEFEVN